MMTTMAKALDFSVLVVLLAFLHFEICTAQAGRRCQITPTEGLTQSGPRILVWLNLPLCHLNAKIKLPALEE